MGSHIKEMVLSQAFVINCNSIQGVGTRLLAQTLVDKLVEGAFHVPTRGAEKKMQIYMLYKGRIKITLLLHFCYRDNSLMI